MNRPLKLIAFVVVGLVSTFLLYLLQVFAILEPLRSAHGGSPESWLGIAFYVMVPVSLFISSGITGYLSSQHIRTRLGFLWVTPGLYSSMAGAAMLLYNWEGIIRWYALEMLQLQVVWFLVSWTGIGMGHLIRRKMQTGSRDAVPQ
jgi:hypothetical protein